MEMLHKLMTDQYTEAHFEALLQMMDRLHDAAAMRDLESATPLDARNVIGWLDDIIYTAEETIRELQKTAPRVNEREEWSRN